MWDIRARLHPLPLFQLPPVTIRVYQGRAPHGRCATDFQIIKNPAINSTLALFPRSNFSPLFSYLGTSLSSVMLVLAASIKGSPTRDFTTSGFFHESVVPGPVSIPLGPFQIFWKFAAIFSNEFLSMSTTPAISCSPVSRIFSDCRCRWYRR